MSIKQQIESELKAALLSGEKEKVTTLRGLKSAILNAEIAQGKRDTGLDEATVIQLLSKEAKSRQESADLYIKGGEQGRADNELREKALIETYLPKQLDDNELSKLVDEAIAEAGELSQQSMGRIIGLVRDKAAGQADGGRIAAMVRGRL